MGSCVDGDGWGDTLKYLGGLCGLLSDRFFIPHKNSHPKDKNPLGFTELICYNEVMNYGKLLMSLVLCFIAMVGAVMLFDD